MKKIFVFLSLSLFVFVSCGPSLESEQESWTKNLERAGNLKSQYPAFAQLITQKVEKATAVMEEAKAISNEEDKLKKMVEANDYIESGAVGGLNSMQNDISTIKSSRSKLMNLKAKSNAMDADRAKEQGRIAVEQAENLLATVYPMDPVTAEQQINAVSVKLKSAKDELERVISAINKKDKDKEAKEKEKEKTKEQEVEQKKEEVKKETSPIKCSYCGSSSPAGSTKCSSCGAGL